MKYWRAAFAHAAVATALATASVASAEPERVITTRDLATLRDVRSLSVSPDGAWAAFQIVQADPDRNTYGIHWHVVATANAGASRKVADTGDVAPNFALGLDHPLGGREPPPAPIWAPDSAWITYLRWDGERAQIWRVRPRGGSPEQLTQGKSHVRRFVYTLDGARILYEIGPSLAHIAEALAAESRTGFLFDGRFYPAYDRVPVLPATTAVIAGTTVPQSTSHPVWTYDLRKRHERPATEAEQAEFKTLTAASQPQDALRRVGLTKASSRGSLAWTEARDPQRQGFKPPVTVVTQSSRQSAPVACTAAECADQFIRDWWWRNEEELIFLRAEGRQRTDAGLYSWRIGDGSVRTLFRTEGKLLGHSSSTGDAQSSCAIGSGRLICFYEEWSSPRRLVAIDLDSGAMQTLYEPNPDFARFELGPTPRRLEFRAGSGEIYTGVLALPVKRTAGERLPLVVLTYRCTGFLRGGVGDEYPAFPLTAQGFAVLCLEAPEDPERSATMDLTALETWYQGPGGAIGGRFVESLEAAIGSLEDNEGIDPDRVGVTGLSHGAQLVGWGLVGMPRLGAAIASGAPGGGDASIYYLSAEYFRTALKDAYGLDNPRKAPQPWQAISLAAQVDRVRAPLLINAADHEMMELLESHITLRDAGRAVETYVYPDEYHWKWQPAHRLAIYNRNIDWMNFWLRGVQDPSREKASQYQRWTVLKERVEALRSERSGR